MIKKLNILLFVLVGLLLAAKFARDRLQTPTSVAEEDAPAIAVRNADLPINVYFESWPPFALVNPVTHRNGYALDIVKAIFPKARLIPIDEPRTNAASSLVGDPLGVNVLDGRRPDLLRYPAAPTPIVEEDLVVYTLRTNAWTYTDAASLDRLRLVFGEDYLDSEVLRNLLARKSGRVRVLRHTEPAFAAPLGLVNAGEADGVVMGASFYKTVKLLGMNPETLLFYRISSPIDRIPLLLTVSNLDEALSRRIIDAYEKGLREITASGELRRIREYYGLSDAPKPPKGPDA